MDIRVIFLLGLEALLALFLLFRSGVLESRRALLLSLLLLAAAFFVRGICLDYETLDYQDFLRHWVEHFRRSRGFAGLADPIGNYNIPYMYFLALFSYSDIDDLYLIKLTSVFFDVVLAWASMQLLGMVRSGAAARLGCFFTVLFLPTVILNGSLWGQCDSIYAALAVLSVYLALDDRPVLSVLSMTLSFGFKLQAVFLMPVMVVLWLLKKYKLWHFAIFPVGYVLLVLPAVLCGRPFIETLTLYSSQTGSIGDGLNYNSSSVYALFDGIQNETAAAELGIAAAFGFMLLVLLVCFMKRRRLNNAAVLAVSVLLAVGVPFLLPHMHDRYFFLADVLTVVMAFACVQYMASALLTQFASLLGYHAYLRMRYFLPMRYGSYALMATLLMAAVMLIVALRKGKADFLPDPEGS